MSAFLSPVFGAGAQLFANDGSVLSGGLIYTYISGSSTPAATYVDNTQGIANANPIVLDSGGRPTHEIWLTSAIQYKFVVTDALGNQVGYVYDNVSGVNDANYPMSNLSEWVLGSTPTYIGTTSFSVPGNQTATYVAGRRLKSSVTAGTVYSSIYSSSYGAGITTVTVTNDSTTLDSGLSIIQYALISGTPSSLPTTLITSGSLIAQTNTAYTTGGASGAFTLSPSPAIASYIAKQAFDVTFHTACGAGATINISGLGDIALVKSDGAGGYTAIGLNDITTGWVSQVVVLNGTQALVRLPAAGAYAPTVSPTFTGNPKAPTPTTGDSSVSLATTAFVQAAAFSAALPLQATVVNAHLRSKGAGTAAWHEDSFTTLTVAGTLLAWNPYRFNTATQTYLLPASPTDGDECLLANIGTNVNNVLSGNGHNIVGPYNSAASFTMDVAYAIYGVKYDSVSTVWRAF